MKKIILWTFGFILSIIAISNADTVRRSSSSSFSSSSSHSRTTSTGTGWQPPPGYLSRIGQTQQVPDKFTELEGQQEQMEEDWDDLNLLKQKSEPAKGSNLQAGAVTCATPVQTANGLIKGKLVKSPTGKDVCAFLGIPYAKPPTGDLRFKRPVPKEHWTGTLETTALPNSCSQFEPKERSIWDPNTKVSEDCLYLNIWVPLSILKSKGPVAVMIWIHGGGFYAGTSSLEIYDGAILAGDYDVVVASMNYRLGPLGFLYFGCEEAPGNMGLLDQHLALEWLRDNVAQFGGNPSGLTVFGESAGSFSTSWHLLSPLSKPMIKRAIMVSGATNEILYKEPEDLIGVSYEVAELLGCYSRSAYGNQNISDIMSCLRKVGHSKVSTVEYKQKYMFDYPAVATMDGYFLPDSPQNILKSQTNARADLMIGNTQDEGSLFLLMKYPEYFSWDPTKVPVISYNVFESTVGRMFANKAIVEVDAIVDRYTNWKNLDDTNENLKRLIAIAGDVGFLCPDVDFANKWAAQGQRVYFFMFNHRSIVNPTPKWVGVKHADDCEYYFGGPLKDAKRATAEKNLSKKMMELYTNFAKTGTPSKNWATYTPAYPVFLDLNATIISDQSTNNIFGPKAESCVFWNRELPRLHQCAGASAQNRQCGSKVPKSCGEVKFGGWNSGNQCGGQGLGQAAPDAGWKLPSSTGGGVQGGNTKLPANQNQNQASLPLPYPPISQPTAKF